MSQSVKLLDCHPATADLRQEVIAGLRRPLKELPCKLFYDQHGSLLFDRICELDEYYPTRTETKIMRDNGDAIAAAVGPKNLVIEYGSGASDKTRILLDHLDDPVGYVPIDISRDHMLQSSRRISAAYPRLEVLPVCADYEQPFTVPMPTHPPTNRLVYFPGSTIGNFHLAESKRFLSRMAGHAGPSGRMLIGVDVKKDPAILTRAYNDAEGVTAEFNMNILRRINEELGTCFDTGAFEHHAYYNEAAGRIEMHLVSLVRQTVEIGQWQFDFEEGESIWTESSYKFHVDEFAEIAGDAGFNLDRVWQDERGLFTVQLYSVQE